MPGRDGLQVAVVIGIAKVALEHIVVDIADREICAYPRNAHGLELQVGHRARGILRQGLIDVQSDLLAWDHLLSDEVISDNLLGQIVGHSISRFCCAFRSPGFSVQATYYA